MKNATLVLGASDNPSRYSYLALNRLVARQHPVLAIGSRIARVAGVDIRTEPISTEDVDTVTVYLGAANQRPYYDYLLSLKPSRIIFNPGAENPELATLAAGQGIATMEACTLVLLSTGQY